MSIVGGVNDVGGHSSALAESGRDTCDKSAKGMGQRMDGRTDGWMDGQKDGRTDGWTDGQMEGRTNGRTEGKTDGLTEERTDGRTVGWTVLEGVNRTENKPNGSRE